MTIVIYLFIFCSSSLSFIIRMHRFGSFVIKIKFDNLERQRQPEKQGNEVRRRSNQAG